LRVNWNLKIPAETRDGRQLGFSGAGANAFSFANSFGGRLGGLGYGGSNAFAASSAQAGGYGGGLGFGGANAAASAQANSFGNGGGFIGWSADLLILA